VVNGNGQPEQPAPARKQRMGQPAAADAAAPKQRMGQPAAADAAALKQRMGQPAAADAAAPKQRMGQPAAADAAAPESRVVAAEPRAVPETGTGGASVQDVAASRKAPGSASSKPVVSQEWKRRIATVLAIVLIAVGGVFLARWLLTIPEVDGFVQAYPGTSTMPETAPTGIPAWLGWQHFLNMFFIVLIIRTGLQVRLERRPPGYWTPKANSFFSPRGSTPKKVSLSQWLHQLLDVLWVLNGLIFIVLLLVSGHWMRIVPTNWDIVPNSLSTMLQYASLNWPQENGWIHYNALQVLAYFTTVFIMAPLAVLSGIRFSTWWPDKNARLSKMYPIELARAVHFPVMIYFVAFTIVHVFLVVFTGVLRNLNHMYTSRDVVDWWGLAVFAASLLAVAAAWFLAKPVFIAPLAGFMGKLSK
jgi:thiosulfate reductase cytochrome b subunit